MNFYQYSQLTFNDVFQFLNAGWVTLSLTLLSIFLGTVLGTALGLIRCSKNRVVSALPLLLIEPLRNSPLVAQLFLIYFGLPTIGLIMLDAFSAAVLAISLNTAAFFAVLVHNSVISIPQTQWEAGYALGHGRLSVFCHIILQQSLRLLIPQAITLYITQLQCTSLVSLISLIDLTKLGQNLSNRTLQPFLIWGIVFVIYFDLSYPFSRLSKYLEKRFAFDY